MNRHNDEKKLGERREHLFQKEQNIQEAENQRELEKQNLQNVNEQLKNHESELTEQKLRLDVRKKKTLTYRQN